MAPQAAARIAAPVEIFIVSAPSPPFYFCMDNENNKCPPEHSPVPTISTKYWIVEGKGTDKLCCRMASAIPANSSAVSPYVQDESVTFYIPRCFSLCTFARNKERKAAI